MMTKELKQTCKDLSISPIHIGEGIYSIMVLVTPVMAQKLLDKFITNRPINRDNVNILGNQMLFGEWKKTGESITCDSDFFSQP